MAKRKTTGSNSTIGADEDKYSEWRVRDAMDTLRRAEEISRDKKMMAKCKAMAEKQAEEMKEFAHKASMLAKAGSISESAMAKMHHKMKA